MWQSGNQYISRMRRSLLKSELKYGSRFEKSPVRRKDFRKSFNTEAEFGRNLPNLLVSHHFISLSNKSRINEALGTGMYIWLKMANVHRWMADDILSQELDKIMLKRMTAYGLAIRASCVVSFLVQFHIQKSCDWKLTGEDSLSLWRKNLRILWTCKMRDIRNAANTITSSKKTWYETMPGSSKPQIPSRTSSIWSILTHEYRSFSQWISSLDC